MDVAKGEREILLLKVTKEHFLGEDLIHIDFERNLSAIQSRRPRQMSRQFLCLISDSFISIIIKSLAQLVLCM
jgi:hypothetical protein